jgi:hypothetical protein
MGLHRPKPVAGAAAVLSQEAAHRWFMADLMLIGLVAVLALAAVVTAGRQIAHRRACDRLALEMSASVHAVQAYLQQNHPGASLAQSGDLPEEVAKLAPDLDWSRPTPVGGIYRWVPATQGNPSVAGLITVTAFPPLAPLQLTPGDLAALDRELDDGNLATGNFRAGFNGWPVMLVRTGQTTSP